MFEYKLLHYDLSEDYYIMIQVIFYFKNCILFFFAKLHEPFLLSNAKAFNTHVVRGDKTSFIFFTI